MSRIGELMTLFMQESEETRRSTKTIVDFLRERTVMDGSDRLRRRKSLQERLRLKNMVCCVSTWGLGPSTMSIQGDDHDDENDVIDSIIHQQIDDLNLTPLNTTSNQDCISPSPRMNLADALAAERHLRSAAEDVIANNDDSLTTEVGTPSRISLMRLLEETGGQDDDDEKEVDPKEGLGRDQMCCVCMGRKKGAAFIPCGHTFCRVCSRELWLNRGTCPLCNRSILEILDIY